MTKLRELLPANRLVALIGLLTAIGVVIASFQTSLVPGSPAAEALAKAAGVVAGIVTVLGIVLKFMDGSQNWDSLMLSGAPKVTGVTVVANSTVTDTDTGEVSEAEILAHSDAAWEGAEQGAVPASEMDRYAGFERRAGVQPEPSTTPPLLPGEDAGNIGKNAGDPPLRPTE